MALRKVTCIVCPLGCEIDVDMDGKNIEKISGYSCKRGEVYARTEVTDPRRILTTTMRVANGLYPLVSVKSAQGLPKGVLMQCMDIINQTRVDAPVHIGDTLIENIRGTGVDIVATAHCSAYNERDGLCKRDDGQNSAASSQQQMATV